MNGRRTAKTERGQTLILFVAVFSVLLAFAAFSIDQGLWLNHRRIAQKDADAAARAGAAQYLADVNNPDFGAASIAALGMAAANGADADVNTPPTFTPGCDDGTTTTCARSSCPLVDGSVIDDAPSIEIAVPRPAPGLFVRAFGGGDADDIGARSTACVGSASEIQSEVIEMIPVWFTRPPTSGSDPNKNYCGDPPGEGYTIAGEVCVIFSTNGGDLDSAGLFRRGSGNTTCGPTNDAGILNAIEAGLGTYNCVVDQRIRDESVNDDDVLDAFQARLEQTDECSADLADPEDTQTAFGATMQALGTEARDGPDFTFPDHDGGGPGDDDPDSTVYQQRACFSPRLALIPLVNQTPSGNKTIVGFTAVYILGCYEDDDPRSATTTMNKCRPADRGQGNHDTEVRAGIVRIYVPGAAVQDIQGIDTSGSDGWVGTAASLAIQTTR